MLGHHKPAVLLAPMDGLTDSPMRALQGELGGFCFAVSEFIRVSGHPVPEKVFHRDVPELLTGGKTATGMPVQVQILGGIPELMAESAMNAWKAGALAVDINFGCPAPTVNRHDGGATILKSPCRVRDIVAAVRQALPAQVPLSAKLRLGWSNIDEVDEIAAMAAEGGADWLVIHARTKEQKYAPPVFWKKLGQVREAHSIPVVANGDIWSLEDFRICRGETGCQHYMLGRGAIANPGLSQQVAAELGLSGPYRREKPDWVLLLRRLSGHCQQQTPRLRKKTLHRLKQWLNFARRFGDFPHFDLVKRVKTEEELLTLLSEATHALTP